MYRKMYLKTFEIDKNVYIVGPTNENIKPLLYLKCTNKGAYNQPRNNQKMYLILRFQIVSTLCNLSVHFNPTNFGTEKVPKCTNDLIVSARVRQPVSW